MLTMQSYMAKKILIFKNIFSLTCDDGTSNDCLTCNTTAINHRTDNSSIH